MVGLMVLQSVNVWKLWKYSITWLRLLVGFLGSSGTLGLWLLRILLCIEWTGQEIWNAFQIWQHLWGSPIIGLLFDFTFSWQWAKDIYRYIQYSLLLRLWVVFDSYSRDSLWKIKCEKRNNTDLEVTGSWLHSFVFTYYVKWG